MRIKHYTLIVAFLAISMGIPLVQGCSDPFDEYGNGGTEMPVRDGWTSVSMSVEGLGLRNSLTRSLTPEGENSTAAERIRVLVFDKDNKFSYEANKAYENGNKAEPIPTNHHELNNTNHAYKLNYHQP